MEPTNDQPTWPDDELRSDMPSDMEPEPGPSENAAPPADGEPPIANAAAEDNQPSATDASQPPRGPRIEIDVVAGDITIRGGSTHVLLHTDDDNDDREAEDRGGVLRFSWLPGDSELSVPDGAEIAVRRVEGDLDANALDAILIVHHIAGDVLLDGVAACELMHVSGDVSARRSGTVRLRTASGSVELSDVERAPLLGHIAGDLECSNLGGLELHDSVGGDVTLDRCGDVTILGTIGGDLRVDRSTVRVNGSSIGGDVRVANVVGASLSAIGGDFRVAGASGMIEVSSIGGDVRISDTTSRVRIGSIGGDARAQDIPGGLSIRRAGGDVSLDTALGPQAEYDIHTSGDISMQVRGEVNARFVAQTFGGEIRTQLPLTVEKGRRRNLVGVLGRGDATVTLRSDGGDISLAANERQEETHMKGDDFVGNGEDERERTWEGGFGRHRFRVGWDRGSNHAGFSFKGPFTQDDDPDALGNPSGRDFHFRWERGQGPRASGEYEERLNDLRDKAERLARRTAEQAQRYAESAARRARDTDWDGIGREVRSAVERAMADLEDTFKDLRQDWDSRRGPRPGAGTSKPTAQRVKIEYDDPSDPDAGPAASASTSDELEAQRRSILEELRNGVISLDEAERRLNDLR
ncbi:MAG TPA: DUF4097 family beta strand repeat-containing protein [Ktedonobacterales bacterium]|nr:DUF4097 family beta strand repeat-containing protein [Ktedonobacterales bacterium]